MAVKSYEDLSPIDLGSKHGPMAIKSPATVM